MAGFDDLLDPLREIPRYQSTEPHVVGTTLDEIVTVLDGDEEPINFATGYTAVMTPHVPVRSGGSSLLLGSSTGLRALSAFTHVLTSGRQIVLGANGEIHLAATPAASAALFASYAGLTARITLLVTRISDGKTTAIFHDCYLPLRSKLNA